MGGEHLVGDRAHASPGIARRRGEFVERRGGVEAVAAHQQPDRALDRHAAVERYLQLVDDLAVPASQQCFAKRASSRWL